MKRLYVGVLATIGMLLALGSATALSEGRTDVILAGSQPQVDYHAEAAAARPADGGATIIGGNIQIKSDRGVDQGIAGACDPDPRFGTHPRPDDQGCTWATPAGAGEDFISFGRTVQNDLPKDSGELPNDTDTSPNGAFVPQTTPTRERFNGRGGLDADGALFMEQPPGARRRGPELQDQRHGGSSTTCRRRATPTTAGGGCAARVLSRSSTTTCR